MQGKSVLPDGGWAARLRRLVAKDLSRTDCGKMASKTPDRDRLGKSVVRLRLKRRY